MLEQAALLSAEWSVARGRVQRARPWSSSATPRTRLWRSAACWSTRTTPPRIDITGSFEDVTGDKMKQDRAVITGTLTYRLSPDIQIPIGIIHASKPEYLGEPDRRLSAHLGLSFKAPF